MLCGSVSIYGARNRVFKERHEACRNPSRHLEKQLCSKKLQKCIYNMILVFFFFFFNSTCWDWETGNKILLNAMSKRITFFFFFPICSYVFQNICHKLAIFTITFFESIWKRRLFFPLLLIWSLYYLNFRVFGYENDFSQIYLWYIQEINYVCFFFLF